SPSDAASAHPAPLSLHDALPISVDQYPSNVGLGITFASKSFDKKTGDWVSCIAKNYGSTALKDHGSISGFKVNTEVKDANEVTTDRKSTRLNSSHVKISYAVFCL